MKTLRLLLVPVSIFLIALGALGQLSNQLPDVAYNYRGVLYFATGGGQIVRSVKTTVPIGGFAVSRDLQWVIFTPPRDQKISGGPFWILSLPTNKLGRMPLDPYYNQFLAGGRTEFYTDPDFSPDGTQVVFAAHAEATGDTFQTRGPLEVLDLKERHIRILKDTLDDELWPLDYLYEPHWSTDGKRILYNYAGGSSISDSDGTKEEELGIPQSESDSSTYGMAAIGWLGPQCVLYEIGGNAKSDPARVLNLKTEKTSSAAESLQLPEQTLRGLAAFSPGLWVHADGSQYRVENGQRSWLVPGDTKTTHVQLLRGGDPEQIPSDCR